MKIDAHQHFWLPARGDYGWMSGAGLEHLRKPFLPPDLSPHLKAFGIERTVLVQAATTVNETEYMLGLADATDFVGKVVGWIDFENRDDLKHLQRLANHPKFSGVRPMISGAAWRSQSGAARPEKAGTKTRPRSMADGPSKC